MGAACVVSELSNSCVEAIPEGPPILQARPNSSWASVTSSIRAHSLLRAPLLPLRARQQHPRPTSLSKQALPCSPSQPRGSAHCSAEVQTLAAAPAGRALCCLRCRQSSVHWVWAEQSTSSHVKQHWLPKVKGDSTWPIAFSQLSAVAAVSLPFALRTYVVIASPKAGHAHRLGVPVLCLLS